MLCTLFMHALAVGMLAHILPNVHAGMMHVLSLAPCARPEPGLEHAGKEVLRRSADEETLHILKCWQCRSSDLQKEPG